MVALVIALLEHPENHLQDSRETLMNVSNHRPSILIVEDDHAQQMVMRILCEKFGFTVYVVSSGAEAITAVKNFDGRYDAILMEWTTPTMSGSDTTTGIRQVEAVKGIHTPIVAVTAQAMVGDRQRCLDAGMD